MGKRIQMIKDYLNDKFVRKFKLMLERFGKFLSVTLAASIPLMTWIFSFISISPIVTFLTIVYTGFVALSIGCIFDIFKRNGYHEAAAEMSSEPQSGQDSNIE